METRTEIEPVVHRLKCWPDFFQAIRAGRKTFDVRKGNDRQYTEGDYLILEEWDREDAAYTGRVLLRRISYVMHGGEWLPADVWVLGLEYPKA